ncbi:MAG: hypothetical protein R3300_19025, partial [Candidatus Promineifilaceae bacterium]|nr:hypothetical protein [Candidatus Promineifilaceae bacterium]
MAHYFNFSARLGSDPAAVRDAAKSWWQLCRRDPRWTPPRWSQLAGSWRAKRGGQLPAHLQRLAAVAIILQAVRRRQRRDAAPGEDALSLG